MIDPHENSGRFRGTTRRADRASRSISLLNVANGIQRECPWIAFLRALNWLLTPFLSLSCSLSSTSEKGLISYSHQAADDVTAL